MKYNEILLRDPRKEGGRLSVIGVGEGAVILGTRVHLMPEKRDPLVVDKEKGR